MGNEAEQKGAAIQGDFEFRKACSATFITPQGDAVRGEQHRLDTTGTIGIQSLPLDAESGPCILVGDRGPV
nr:MAG TPA: hypothetical protein [Caudoviricetes sp.]